MGGFLAGIFGRGDQEDKSNPEAQEAASSPFAQPAGDNKSVRGAKRSQADHDSAGTVSVPPDLYYAIAALKGRQPANDRAPKFAFTHLFPISAEIAEEDAVREAARVKAEEEAAKNLQVGKFAPGKGVFLGVWAPKDRDGRSLNKTFNLFAAPHDLGLDENDNGTKLVATYNNAAKAVSKIGNLLGHKGGNYANDTLLYKALKDGSYNGEWFIPTRDILHGQDKDGNNVQNDHILGHKDDGAFRGTYTLASGSGHAHWYWSCTELPDVPSVVYDVRLSDGHDGWGRKDDDELSARVVRAELRL